MSSGSRSAPTSAAAPRRCRRNRADATLLTAPAYFRLEEAGFKTLANLADTTTSTRPPCTCSEKSHHGDPEAARGDHQGPGRSHQALLRGQGVRGESYIAFDKQPEADVERIYDLYKNGNIFERVPYVLAPAIKSIVAQQVDPQIAAR